MNNFKSHVTAKYQILAISTVTIPKGSLLFHGTVEKFSTDLKAGIDGLIWFSDTPKIAQLYIPKAGATNHVNAAGLIRPTKDKFVQKIQKDLLGIEYDMDKVEWEGHRLKSWPNPINWKSSPTEKEIESILEKKGFKKGDYGNYEFKFHDNRILKPDESAEGRLFIAKVKDDLKIWKKARGEEDLMDLQYHDLKGFDAAKAKGFDGVLIDDFAQSKEHGNFGHLSVGVFDTTKLDVKSIPAEYREWDYKAKGTPEYPNAPEMFLNKL